MTLPADEWLTAAEAAAVAKAHPQTIYKACRRKELAASRRGRTWMIRRSAVDEWIEKGAA